MAWRTSAHVNTIRPSFIPESSLLAGRATDTPPNCASSCRIASGQAALMADNGATTRPISLAGAAATAGAGEGAAVGRGAGLGAAGAAGGGAGAAGLAAKGRGAAGFCDAALGRGAGVTGLGAAGAGVTGLTEVGGGAAGLGATGAGAGAAAWTGAGAGGGGGAGATGAGAAAGAGAPGVTGLSTRAPLLFLPANTPVTSSGASRRFWPARRLRPEGPMAARIGAKGNSIGNSSWLALSANDPLGAALRRLANGTRTAPEESWETADLAESV